MKLTLTALLTSLIISTSGFASSDLIKDRINELSSAKTVKKAVVQRQGFFASHKLVMIYSSTCQYCHKFSPVLKQWSDNFNAPVKPLSLDGKPIEGFSNFEVATDDFVNAAYGDSPHGTPALFIVNDKTNAIFPVLFGNSDYSELNTRLQEFIPKIIKFEAGA